MKTTTQPSQKLQAVRTLETRLNNINDWTTVKHGKILGLHLTLIVSKISSTQSTFEDQTLLLDMDISILAWEDGQVRASWGNGD